MSYPDEQGASLRREQAAATRARRARMTLLERHRWTAEQAARQSTVPAARIGRSVNASRDPGMPPVQQLIDFTNADEIIERGIRMREEILDELAGFGPARDYTTMSALEKDRLLIGEYAHLSPAEIEVDYPRLGSAATVARKRSVIRRYAREVEALRVEGYRSFEIRERLGLSDDDLVLAREWAVHHESGK